MQYYENRLFRKLVAVENHLDKINEFEYYSEVSQKAIGCYKIYIRLLIDNFQEIDVSVIRKIYTDLNFNVIPSMRILQRSTTENIPWSMVSCLDDLLNKCLGDQYLLLFRPQWTFNYSVQIFCLVEALKDKAKKIFPFMIKEIDDTFPKEKIHVFSFPYLEKTNVLLHSVIGHEIGHFYHAKWFNAKDTQNKLNSVFTDLIQKYASVSKDDLIKPAEDAQYGMNVIGGMCREIFSDIVGYALFGPSIVFSLYYISIFEQKLDLPSEKNRYYPTIKYRIRFLYENFLRKEVFFNEIHDPEINSISINIKEQIEKYLSETDDLVIVYKNELELDHFEKLSKDFIDSIKDKFDSFTMEEKKIKSMFETLKNGIPINEYELLPTEMNEILFVGWIKYFYDVVASTKFEYIQDYQVTMRLLLKSLNSSYIHKRFIGRM